MLLHILNRSPATSEVYRQALSAMGAADRLLLIEDGVQGALGPLVECFGDLTGRLYALEEDLSARGLVPLCDASVVKVDVEGFVTLTEEAMRTVSWF
ncbi:MAG: sulfurtransferase complex subunit TusB [Halomonas sp.]|uniref:sulfurtransferase complex subunit TusB n=1 Tax=Halomonas sp. TaxID=1486246 RepID=UPI001A078613|nr:sulfurtransferase complex subunit TusB [Halomonas sp.]MBE0487786.1 sulfurtransferase complex subunit TusB [Halomonas sp.]